VRKDLTRVADYARLLASVGIDAGSMPTCGGLAVHFSVPVCCQGPDSIRPQAASQAASLPHNALRASLQRLAFGLAS
jgi:hypothetical protein